MVNVRSYEFLDRVQDRAETHGLEGAFNIKVGNGTRKPTKEHGLITEADVIAHAQPHQDKEEKLRQASEEALIGFHQKALTGDVVNELKAKDGTVMATVKDSSMHCADADVNQRDGGLMLCQLIKSSVSGHCLGQQQPQLPRDSLELD